MPGARGSLPGIAAVLRRATRGVVVLGRVDGDARGDVARLIRDLRWPVVHADVQSGLRGAAQRLNLLVARPNAVLGVITQRPDVVLQIGSSPVSGGAGKAWPTSN